ncbi:MAG: hypothetical protein IJV96_06110 [Clostridia bacterium]|nr:hypothetical protein [Clostridia bacterium]
MKKKILSMLLLVAMIVTAIPVMTTAAGAADNANAYASYEDLYVQDHLESLYMAFVGDTSSLSLETAGSGRNDSSWANKVEGGARAWLKNDGINKGVAWTVGKYGGVGFDYKYGYLDAEGNFVAQKFSCQDSGNQALIFNGINDQNGIAAMPDEDVTVEYVAEYKPVYVAADETGMTFATDADGNRIETYGATKADGTQYYSGIPGYDNWPVDSLGWFQAYTANMDASTWSGGRNAIHFVFDNNTWTSGGNGRWVGSGDAWNGNSGLNIQSNPFHKLGSIYSYAYVIDETVTTTEGGTTTTALFELYRDGALYKSNASKLSSSANGVAGNGYYNLADKGNGNSFFLSAGAPTDFYVIRVYSDLLTAGEKAQNHMVDVLAYYDVKVPDYDATIEGLKANAASFAEIGFAKDDSTYSANKTAVQALIDDAKATVAYQLYVTDGIVGLFTAFDGADDETVNLAAKTWANRVAGSSYNASLKAVHGSWKQGDFGGIGFDIFLGQIADDGTVGATSAYSTHKDQTTRLEFDVNLLPAGDYTIDYLALYRHLYVADAEASAAAGVGVPAKDANGAYLNPVNYPDIAASSDIATWDFGSRLGSEVLGNFLGIHQKLGISEAWGGGAWAVRWGYGLATGRYSNPTWFSGMSSASGALHNGPSDPLQQNGVLQSFSYTRDETATTYTVTETVDEVETEVTKDGFDTIFSIYRNAGLYSKGSVSAASYTAGNKAFWMSAQRPADFFAVRVYDRVLTVGELMQNRAADIALYYGLNLTLDLVQDDELKAKLVKALEGASFELNADAKAAKALELQATIDAIAPVEKLDGLADMYVQGGLTALYTAFAGDAYVDLANGTWTDRVSGATATLGNKAYWATGANGGVGVTQLWGSYDGGVFNATAATNTFDVLGTRLDFGIDQLPYDDYTVEYVAQYNNVMAVDASGNPVEAIINIADATWPSNAALGGNQTIANSAVDALGNLTSWSAGGRDKAFAAGAVSHYGGVGSVAWKHNDDRDVNGWNHGNGYECLFKASELWQTRGSVNTFEISRDTTTPTYNTFTLTKNGATYSTTTDKARSTAVERSYDNDYFYLGERLSVDYYAVRIYDRLLTAEERTQNHFVDILLYYGLEIPEACLNDAAAMDSIAALVDGTAFETDASVYSATKTTLQNAIDTAFVTITVIVDGEETATAVNGGVWNAPATVDGKVLLGWQLMGETPVLYDAGASIPVAEGDVLRAIALTKPATTNDYSVKLMGEDGLGMRFTATLSKTEYLLLLEAYGEDNVSLGMLITPERYVERAGVFTKEGLKAWAESLNSDETPYVDIPLGGVWKMEGDVLTLAGSLYNFSRTTIENNISFAAVAYVNIDVDGDGVIDQTVYGDFAAETCRTAKDVMEYVKDSFYDDLGETQQGWLNSFLANYN